MRRADWIAGAALVVLWLVFFWRLFTPVAADQASLTQGDFSGQFVAFGGYQYSRFAAGEIPLWNPYNNGGLPFIADTQAAVFYPPRLMTIALSHIAGGWTYHALELEMTLHVLLLTLMMYLFVKRLTGSALGGVIAAVIAGYGGYVSGYPPLQLALLEAGVWLPLAALGILEATRTDRLGWLCLGVTGVALGLSWLAGHPQTSWFLTYFLVAYFAYRIAAQRLPWQTFLAGTAWFGVISFGVCAVTLLPGLEYLARASRSDLGFEAKGGGFPMRDIVQMLFPGIVSQWSPLYVGITGLALALIAVWRRLPETLFWGGVAVFALLLSIGADGALYHALYNVLPGLRFFRGQERAAYLVAHSLAILAGIGTAHLLTLEPERVRRALAALVALTLVPALLVMVLWLASPQVYASVTDPLLFSTIIAVALLVLLPEIPRTSVLRLALAAVLVIELFSVNIDNGNYDPVPPQEQLSRAALLEIPLADTAVPFRVDGQRVLGANYGSLYGLADIQGISPLFLSGPQQIIEYGLPDERAWELFAVRYVYSDWEALNVPGVVLAEGEDAQGAVRLHQLTAPRPFAHLLYEAVVVESDDAARALLADPEFDPRTTAILHKPPGLALDGRSAPPGAGTTVTAYAPENFTIIANTSANAVLSLAHVDYPGWRATINGQEAPLIRAYGGLTALVLPPGEHHIEMRYDPLTYRAGALLSLMTWGGLGLLVVVRLTVSRLRPTTAARHS